MIPKLRLVPSDSFLCLVCDVNILATTERRDHGHYFERHPEPSDPWNLDDGPCRNWDLRGVVTIRHDPIVQQIAMVSFPVDSPRDKRFAMIENSRPIQLNCDEQYPSKEILSILKTRQWMDCHGHESCWL